jgi:hypothetical protein
VVAQVLAAAEEEHLDAGLAAGLVGRDHVGLVDAGDVDVLVRLDLGQRPDAVAVERGTLEVERLARRLHALDQRGLHRPAAPRQERLGVGDLGRIDLGRDLADAGRGAALDLVLQAGPGALGEHGVGAVAQQEGALQGDDRAVHRPADAKGPK